MIRFFTQKDKQLHMLVCFLAAIISPMLAIGLAIGKEYGDSKSPTNRWDWMDILADTIGLVPGAVIHMLIIKTLL